MIKNLIKWLTVPFLVFFARAVVRKYKPKIIMVTGSVGKTSTKDAVAAVVESHFYTRKSEKSFNSEFGVPFTIFGAPNPWGNPIAWLKVIKSAIGLTFLPNHYPNMLVLEVGADKPGDLSRILRIATPDAVVVTRLPEIPVHVEAYESPEAVREEEFSPALALPPEAPLILLSEDSYALQNAVRTSARVFTYGRTDHASVHITNVKFLEEKKQVVGMKARAVIDDKPYEFLIRGSVGETQILPGAAALAVAFAFHLPIDPAIEALAQYEPPPGRGRLLKGIRDSVLIDDSYNASPAAVEESLDTLKKFPRAKRRIAILGDMLELGRYSALEHERIGKLAAMSADIVIAVGIRSRTLAVAAHAAEVQTFDDAKSAAVALIEFIESGDVVLIKGSQSMRMERIVQALLQDPMDFKKLPRQEKEWKRKA